MQVDAQCFRQIPSGARSIVVEKLFLVADWATCTHRCADYRADFRALKSLALKSRGPEVPETGDRFFREVHPVYGIIRAVASTTKRSSCQIHVHDTEGTPAC